MENEIKFTYDSAATPAILSHLRAVCRPDKEFPNNTINSIYFDTSDHILAMEKAASDYLKTKIRVRWYDGENIESNSPCFLEFKRKIGSKRMKKRIPLDITPPRLMQNISRPLFLRSIRQHIASDLPDYAGFFFTPQVLVSYIRYRFHEPFSSTRISLDTKIQAMQVRPSAEGKAGRIFLDTSVLEVKGSQNELPTPLRSIVGSQVKKAAFSKYYECHIILNDYQQ